MGEAGIVKNTQRSKKYEFRIEAEKTCEMIRRKNIGEENKNVIKYLNHT